MLYDFVLANREEIILLARRRMKRRMAAIATDGMLENGIPLFLGQLTDAMAPAPSEVMRLVGAADSKKRIGATAALHGQELLRSGLSVAQVVHGYGDVCQVVTALANETNTDISAEDFHVFNRCLDDAIAGAVTAYARERERELAYEGTERLGVLARDLRSFVHTAMLSFDLIKRGVVAVAGSTSAMHSRSLAGLHTLVERSLAEARLAASSPKRERIQVARFIEEIEVVAMMLSAGSGVDLTVQSVDGDIAIDADSQLLTSAILNLLQNAFKFSRAHGKVTLSARAVSNRVLIEVLDECGGMPPGKAKELSRPSDERPGGQPVGLGLSVALRAARANSGDIHVRNIPGMGCVFTVDLPRSTSLPATSLRVLPGGDPDSPGDSGE